jgi:glycosyltransferase involved in cell wall biosynthesis
LKVCSPLWQEDIKAAISALRPDLIFAFRFYLAPFLLPSIGSSLPVWLDVDELESVARLRLANLYASAKHPKEPIARMEVPAYQNLECQQLPLFQRLFAASDLECEAVRARFSEADARVMPNVYPFDLPQKPRQTDDHARLLFVGTFGYFPNKDALQYFVSRVLPKITERSSKPVEVTVVGSGILPTDQSSQFGLKVIGTVPDTTPYYASCDLVIVPLRAGGGTRIKILEAFSHQRAVVSTTVGAEGLAVKDGVELLIADDADVFAEQCLRLIENVDERARLAERGHQFFYRHHSLRVLEERMPYLFGDESAPIG